MGTFSIWHWLVVLVIVVLVFGTKKLRNLGGDLGSAIKGFKEGMKDASTETDNSGTQSGNTTNLTFDQEIKQSSTSTNTFKEGVRSQETTINVEATAVKEDAQKPESSNAPPEPAAKETTQTKN